jgi:hypothetical protein
MALGIQLELALDERALLCIVEDMGAPYCKGIAIAVGVRKGIQVEPPLGQRLFDRRRQDRCRGNYARGARSCCGTIYCVNGSTESQLLRQAELGRKRQSYGVEKL